MRIVYIIDHSGSKIISKFKITNVPYQIISIGAFDIDYRLHIAARNNIIYTIKNGELTTTPIELPNKIIGLVRTEKSIIVGTIDANLHSYSPQGKKNFTIKLPVGITCMELLDIKRLRNFRAVLVALKNSEIRIYNERTLVNIYKAQENIFSMKFGKFGKEEEAFD